MAWQDITVSMLRVLINDLDDTPTYSDNRLIQVLMTSAYLLKQEITFSTTYTINILSQTITPDPSDDKDFMSLLVMKSACQTDFSTYRTKALLDGINAKCGPVSLTVSGHLVGFKNLLVMGPCATFEAMKKDYLFGDGQLSNVCRAILSPFIGNNFDSASLGLLNSVEDIRSERLE